VQSVSVDLGTGGAGPLTLSSVDGDAPLGAPDPLELAAAMAARLHTAPRPAAQQEQPPPQQ
jgi:hypothetical protein